MNQHFSIKIPAILKPLVFLFFLSFLGLNNYLALLLAGLCVLFCWDKRHMSKGFLALSLCLLGHAVIYFFHYSMPPLDWLMKNLVAPITLYAVGSYLAKHTSGLRAAVLMIAGFSLHGALNVFYYLIQAYTIQERALINIWSGKITATLQNALFIPAVALFFYFLFMENRKLIKIAGIATVIIALYSTVITASRTILYLLIIAFTLNAFLYGVKNKKRSGKVLLGVVALSLGILLIYSFDIFGLRSWLESSSLFARLSNADDTANSFSGNVRWKMSQEYLAAILNKPFGNIEATSSNYAHNLFLDMGKFSGLFPALGLFIWSVKQVLSTALVTFHRGQQLSFEGIAFVMASCGMMIIFFLEPIIEGLPVFFAGFCYLCGIMKVYREHACNTLERKNNAN